MLSGVEIDIPASSEEVAVLKSLFAYSVKKETKTKFSPYHHSAFESFVQHKTHIQLNFEGALDAYNEEMRNLIMYPLDASDYDKEKSTESRTEYMIKRREEGDLTNLFQPALLQIFTSLKTMIIGTGGYGHFRSNKYTFSLLSLLSLIESSKLQKVLIIGGEWLDWNERKSWFGLGKKTYWKQEPKELIQRRYHEAKYKIKVDFVKGIEKYGHPYKAYHCVIEKKR